MNRIIAEPLTPAAFAPFGEVLEATGEYRLINGGLCRRHHDRATLDFAGGRAGISVFQADARTLPYTFDLIERHPEGSQAFLPMTADPFLVIVAQDPQATPRAFLTNGAQGINLARGTWHGVLTPLAAPGLFAVVDRIGDGPNLEEHRYTEPWTVIAPQGAANRYARPAPCADGATMNAPGATAPRTIGRAPLCPDAAPVPGGVKPRPAA